MMRAIAIRSRAGYSAYVLEIRRRRDGMPVWSARSDVVSTSTFRTFQDALTAATKITADLNAQQDSIKYILVAHAAEGIVVSEATLMAFADAGVEEAKSILAELIVMGTVAARPPQRLRRKG